MRLKKQTRRGAKFRSHRLDVFLMGARARLLRFSLLWLSLLWALLAAPLAAQEASILVVDLDRAYETSLFGKSMRAQFREDNQDVAAENTLLLNALKDEELQLTEDRATLSAEEFAAAAAAFDAKVQEIRSARLEKIRQVDEQFKNLKPLFFSRIEPFFDLVMREFNATVILEKRSVLRSIEGIDITDLLVERVDDAFLASISATEPAAEN